MGQTMESGQILSLIASFVLVLVLLFATLWVLRRIGVSGLRTQSGRRLAIVDSLWLGNRQRIVLVRVDEKEVVIGVSGQTISLLVELPATSSTSTANPDEVSPDSAQPVSRPEVRADDRSRFVDALRSVVSRGPGKGDR